jgi:hypothetical protein
MKDITMKTPDYFEDNLSEEEVASMEQAGLVEATQMPLLDDEFDAI